MPSFFEQVFEKGKKCFFLHFRLKSIHEEKEATYKPIRKYAPNKI